MLRNYLTVALRSFGRNKLNTFINVFGLAVGLASCILILLYVRDELSYDRWIPAAERIYRLHVRYDFPGRTPLNTTSSAWPSLPALQQDYPQIEGGVRIQRAAPTLTRDGESFFEDGYLADPTFFDVFDLPLTAGDRQTALADVNSIVLSERLAVKYFGGGNPIGQVLTLASPLVNREVKVTGVMKDLPSNTHLKAGFIAPVNAEDYIKVWGNLDNWGNQSFATYVKLREGASIDPVSTTLEPFLRRHVDGQPYMSLSLMALPDLRLHAVAGYAASAVNSQQMAVTAFSIVAVMILAIASINFMNLATARASQRAREVALRKVLGARRGQLVIQFVGEAVLTAVLAMALALAMAALALPPVNAFLEKQLALGLFTAGGVLPWLLALVLLVGAAGGAYPAFYLSRFQPARILKANKSSAAEGSGRLRSALVVVQFAISIGLVLCTGVVYRQTEHVKAMDMGFNQEGLMVLRGMSLPDVKPVADAVKAELSRLPGFSLAAFSSVVPSDRSNSETEVGRTGGGGEVKATVNVRNVGYGFLTTYQARFLAGRDLAEDRAGDDLSAALEGDGTKGGNVVLNDKARRLFGFESPAAALGQMLQVSTGPNDEMSTVAVVGVVEDIQFRSARDELPPTLFFRAGQDRSNLSLRYSGMTQADARAAVQDVWRQLVPGTPMRAEFLGDLVSAQYRDEQRQGVMFAVFAALAIIVACLGLYGLAAFTAARRTKEIGLRKVLGAGVWHIVRLLVWQFSKPVVAANLIAWPVAYLVMRDWLDGFEFRIALSPAYFAAAGLLALAIAWVTVAGHALRVARANPIHALRYE